MKRPDETSRLDFSESRLLTWTPCIVALLICGVGFSLYKRWPAAMFCLDGGGGRGGPDLGREGAGPGDGIAGC